MKCSGSPKGMKKSLPSVVQTFTIRRENFRGGFTCNTNLTRWQTKKTTTIPTRTLVHRSLLPPPEGAEVVRAGPLGSKL